MRTAFEFVVAAVRFVAAVCLTGASVLTAAAVWVSGYPPAAAATAGLLVLAAGFVAHWPTALLLSLACGAGAAGGALIASQLDGDHPDRPGVVALAGTDIWGARHQ